MSREKKFHQLIEEKNQEEKARVWEKIQGKMKEEAPAASTAVEPTTEGIKWSVRWKKVAMFGAAAAVVLIVSIVAAFNFFPQGDITVDNSSSGNDSQNDNRYCTSEEYTANTTEKTIAQHAQEIGEPLLYFNWYDTTEEVTDFVYTLNDTQEVICYRENIINPETGDMLNLYVIDKNIDMDFLQNTEGDNEEQDVYNQVDITWSFNPMKAYASFTYGAYKYNIVLLEPIEEDDILEYAKLLLS